MPHQMGSCSCGKKRHWPKTAVVGDTWKCFNCGEVWTLVSHGGTPTRRVGSKKPKHTKKTSPSRAPARTPQTASNACFPKGTHIITPEGSKDISILTKGDYVISIGDDKKAHVNRILKVKTHRNTRLWSIKFNDGSSIKTTSHHSFNCKNQWVKSKDLIPGDTICCYEHNQIINKTVAISNEMNESEGVYNIYIEGDFNFIADGVLAHSFSYFRVFRTFLWSIYSLIYKLKQQNKINTVARPDKRAC